jgi:hypothetical protein
MYYPNMAILKDSGIDTKCVFIFTYLTAIGLLPGGSVDKKRTSRDGSVGIATGYEAGRQKDWRSSPGTVKNFLFCTSSSPVLRPTQPPIKWVSGSVSPGVKRQGREDDHSPTASADVKKMWIYSSTPHTPSCGST